MLLLRNSTHPGHDFGLPIIYGGSGSERGNGIIADGSGNIAIAGTTSSTSGIATTGSYQTSLAGTQNAFVAKFNSSGAIQWASYYGGSAFEWGNGIIADGNGNITITGITTSTSGIATTGAYQTSFAGSSDAYVAKFNSSGVIQWASYYGGSGNDQGYGIAYDGSGNIAITGYTASTSGIATTGSYQTSFAGSKDAFIAAFTSSGGLPVQLISFDAKLEENLSTGQAGKNVLCTWSTASEVNNDYFEVERFPSTSSGNTLHPEPAEGWKVVGKVKGNGTNNVRIDYQFLDDVSLLDYARSDKLDRTTNHKQTTNIFYRLKQIDFDGKFSYSDVKVITLNQTKNDFVIYPNPTSNELLVSTGSTSNMNLQLFDVKGKLVLQDNFIQHSSFNIQHCSEGIYFLRITDQNSGVVKIQKILVMK